MDLGIMTINERKNAQFIAITQEESIRLVTLDMKLGKRFLLEIHDTYDTRCQM